MPIALVRVTLKTPHPHEKLSQRDKELNRVRNQFLFWSTVVVTGLNGVLLMVFRPTASPPQVEPSVAVSDTSLTGMMVGYMRASDRQKPELIQNLVRAALSGSHGDEPVLVDALKFLVEAFKTEAALSLEWGASFEGIVEFGMHSPRLQAVAELELLRVAQDPNHRRLLVPTLQALYRMGSEVGAAECLNVLSSQRTVALRREVVLLLGAYARDLRSLPNKSALFKRIVQGLERVVEKDAILRPTAALALARVGEEVNDTAIQALLRADASWGEVRAGIEVVRIQRRVDLVSALREVASRGSLPADTQTHVEAILADLDSPGSPPKRSVASKRHK